MKIDNLKKLKDKTSVRVIDLDENDLMPTQYEPEDVVPDYALIWTYVNPFFNAEKIKEVCANITDLLKGTRNVVSIQYDATTPMKVMSINFAVAAYIMTMDALLQATKLIAYNDSLVMRELIMKKFNITSALVDHVLANRAEFEDQVKAARDKVKSRLVKLGHFEEMIEQYIYDFRQDDKAQFTTKIAYIPAFILYHDSTGWVADALKKLFGTVNTPDVYDLGYGYVPGTYVRFQTIINVTPAQWFKRVEDCCESLFANTEYHAFRTEYMNLYLKESLWDMNASYKIKTYFNESDMNVLMNASPVPLLAMHDNTFSAGAKWLFGTTYLSGGITDNTISALVAGKTVQLSSSNSFDSDVTKAWVPDQNAGFSGKEILSSDAVGLKQLGKSAVKLNFTSKNFAKDAEVEAICGNKPVSVFFGKNNDGDAEMSVQLGASTIVTIEYLWGNHTKDGVVYFTNTSKQYQMPLRYRCYDTDVSGTETRYNSAAFMNVSGLPPVFRLYHRGSETYGIDAVQELFDMYDLTPAALYQGQRALQAAWIVTPLKVANNVRAENFAELLDQI